MKTNTPVMILAGAVSLAAVAGITYAVVQQPSPQEPTVSQSGSPAAIATTAPAAQPTAGAAGSKVPVAASGQSGRTPTAAPYAAPSKSTTSADTSATEGTVSRKVESCKVRMALVKDDNPPLNVRSTASTSGTVVGQLKNNTMVTVTQEQDGWFQIVTPVKGWISKQQTENGCNEKVERVSSTTPETTVTLSDRFIGTGTHKYLFTVNKGQTITITRQKGPFPTVMSPNGKALVGGPSDEKRPTWSDQVAEPGEYAVEQDSNFRGYKYSFLVEIK